MHVDGFRFDLAPVLARELYEMDRLGSFFDIIHQDPVLSQVKLIAEPWDLGPGGYQVGNFPGGWAEWNGKYRDTVRRFWRGDPGQLGDLAFRLAGSSDLYGGGERSPHASINFVTCHDGFTLHDLTSYEQKHNQANGEDNRDGTDANWSRNWGVEGPTDDPGVLRMRERVRRSFLAMLAFSQGVPMITAGDEMGHTQRGNNNAYCQDNELSWIDWELDQERQALLDFTRLVFVLRTNPVLRRRSFFKGHPVVPGGLKDVLWLRPDGQEMTEEDWAAPDGHALGMLLSGHATDETDERGRLISGNTVLLLLNGGSRSVMFALPTLPMPGVWAELANSAHAGGRSVRRGRVRVATHSLVLLGFAESV
jgi:glycogen operon protein